MTTPLFDRRHVRRAFSRSAASYDAAARQQHEVEANLLESLDYLDDPKLERPKPQVVLDLGAGPGRASAAMRKRWPKARVVAVDLAMPMLREAGKRSGWWRPFDRVNADVRALPFADGSVDVLFSNLCLQWLEDLPGVFAGFRRVLRPGGLLLVSTFGQDTLFELRTASAEADAAPHVSPFTTLAQFGDALVHAGFRDPVIDRELATAHYPDLATLMRELRTPGAPNALQPPRHTLPGKARFAPAAEAYARMFAGERGLPASWETITAMAWAPPAGAPIREAGAEIATFPANRIPIRRR